MMILVKEVQIIGSRDVVRASEQSKTEARRVRCDGPETTMAFDYIVVEKLVQALCHFVQFWRRRIDQRGGEERAKEWARLVKRALSMSDDTGGDEYDQSKRVHKSAHVEEICLRGCRMESITVVALQLYLYKTVGRGGRPSNEAMPLQCLRPAYHGYPQYVFKALVVRLVRHGIVVSTCRWTLASPKAVAIARLGNVFTSERIDQCPV